jgi:hypothetical protein
MIMTTKTPANLTTIEEASTARWLTKTLANARIETQAVPTAEALDRIRTRVLGVHKPRKAERSIAA